jgi:DNA-binding GntR family transcriptional regulator
MNPDTPNSAGDGLADGLAPYLQLADALRSRIRHGDLAPGDKLPSQPELARHYGLARLPAARWRCAASGVMRAMR